MAALTFAATIDRVLNGFTRPFFGWVSDNIGRENTMFIAFRMEGIGIYMLYLWGQDPVWFVLLSGFVFFAWGEIYSPLPLDLHGHFRFEVRGDQCRPALHGQGNRGAARAVRQLPPEDDAEAGTASS